MKPAETRELLLMWCRLEGPLLHTVDKGTPEWWDWINWRKRHGLASSFHESQPAMTVPRPLPPEDDDELIELARPNTKGYKTRAEA